MLGADTCTVLHFAAAKLCGVRVLKFSIGFGPPLGFGRFRAAWQRSGTDYVIAWLPLGGFVRMLGDTNEDAVGDRTEEPAWRGDPNLESQTLGAKPLWQKLFSSSRPAMNLLLPVVVVWGTLAAGIDRPLAVVGTVERGSPAAAAGLRAGDRIVTVDGAPVRWWDEVEEAVRERPAGRLGLELERGAGAASARGGDPRRGVAPGPRIFRETKGRGGRPQHPRQKAVLGVRTPPRPPRWRGSAGAADRGRRWRRGWTRSAGATAVPEGGR